VPFSQKVPEKPRELALDMLFPWRPTEKRRYSLPYSGFATTFREPDVASALLIYAIWGFEFIPGSQVSRPDNHSWRDSQRQESRRPTSANPTPWIGPSLSPERLLLTLLAVPGSDLLTGPAPLFPPRELNQAALPLNVVGA
jgi:hypothetical protein